MGEINYISRHICFSWKSIRH
ncbi:hypothetical protein KGM_203234 [Danaus plexippus plexippus]|uniref:Uncharacterized protein n=1 Tax=Danaus plexippus plexippus TaxID=278856 RepID=A0A212FP88_DANPL|nr:hypothetical protein KGM_203234 [Danaus plexippus plexippus]